MPWVPLGQSVQFTARVTGLSSTDVIWSAGGKVGGTATAGTISATGLYTAPATMPANAVDGMSLVAAADEALYAAKRAGRDRSSQSIRHGGVRLSA